MKVKAGDVFSIPVDESHIGYGQIVNVPSKHNFIIIVFGKKYRKESVPNLKSIVEDEILFLGYTLDAKLYHKQWIIVGNYTKNLEAVVLPYYKLGTAPEVNVVRYDGTLVRKATTEEAEQLNYQTIIAPVRYENALKAFHKVAEWRDDYALLMYKETLKSVKCVNL